MHMCIQVICKQFVRYALMHNMHTCINTKKTASVTYMHVCIPERLPRVQDISPFFLLFNPIRSNVFLTNAVSSLVSRVRPRTTLPTHGLPETIVRSVHTRRTKRTTSAKNHRPSSLLRAVAAPDLDRGMFLVLRQSRGRVETVKKRASWVPGGRVEHGRERESSVESGHG